MVQKVEHYRTCDWEPEEKEVRVRDERVSVNFAVGSTQYVIDECDNHGGRAMGKLAELTAIASREDGKAQGGGSRRAAASTSFRSPAHRRQTRDVRLWAQKNFPERNVSDFGRIPADLAEKYDEAH